LDRNGFKESGFDTKNKSISVYFNPFSFAGLINHNQVFFSHLSVIGQFIASDF